jgi:peptidoglycan hydrolase CwlO-like protein
MTNLHKAFWHSEENSIKLSMPIAKVDKEKRMVSGFATLDNVDKQQDIVPTDVSVKAFERFRGNLREMHMPIAVGRVVSFKSDKFYNQEENKFYNGVFVNAYISKGAQDTWEKVLDGTLSGFSIGGSIKDSESIYDAEMDKAVRVIKDYDLHELSLVDNPANQFANIVSIEKMSDGQNKIDGIISKVDLENVYWCESDSLIRLSQEEDSSCPSCDKGMTNIGFVESNDSEKNSVVKNLLKSQKNRLGDKLTKAENPDKEGNNMANENVEVTPTTEEVVETPAADVAAVTEEVAAEAPAAEEVVTDENIEKSADAEEAAPAEATPAEDAPVAEEAVVAEAPAAEEASAENAVTPAEESDNANLAKAVDTVQESVDEVQNTVASALGDLVTTVKSLNAKMAELQKSIASAQEEIKGIKGNVDNFGKRVDSLEDDTAIRKSGDLGGIVQETQITRKSMWGGRFLNSADLYR